MNEKRLKEIFVSNRDTSPVVEAYNFVIQELHDDAVVAAVVPSLSDSDRAFNCGRVAVLKDLQSLIADYCEKREEE